jgi:hypothetical protein
MNIEKLLFRTILGSVAVAASAAVLGSLDDIKRYMRIKAM